MRRGPGVLALLALGLAAAGCATVGSPLEQARPEQARPAPPSLPEELVARHNVRSQDFERGGDLQRALQERTIALTINPHDRAAREGQARLQALIERRVAQRLQQGRTALGRGSHGEARRHFLAALVLDPTNRRVFEALQQDVPEVEVILHTVRAGETLASLAQRYYGDSARAEVIFETNQLSPGARLAVGQPLKVPEILGVPFVRAEPVREPARPGLRREPAAPAREDAVEANPLLVDAQEALQRSAYADALADLERLLAGEPNNAEALGLKKHALYRQAQTQLSAQKYDESYRALTALNQFAPNYEDSATLLQQVRRAMVDERYSQGLRLFRQEKLAEAIGEWRAVLELDPQHANARRNIEQAEKLLRSLD
ncbi:MAG: LysM peptidoglycan-binding domain-containing protein, partial [Candidatus Rokuibacteriota bacterium]